MLNYIWPGFIIVSFCFSLIFGKTAEVNKSIFLYSKEAVETTISFFETMCMWNGFIKIIQSTSLINKINDTLEPLMKFLFPKISKKDEAYSNISMNISANILGIGNAATPQRINGYGKFKEKK